MPWVALQHLKAFMESALLSPGMSRCLRPAPGRFLPPSQGLKHEGQIASPPPRDFTQKWRHESRAVTETLSLSQEKSAPVGKWP